MNVLVPLDGLQVIPVRAVAFATGDLLTPHAIAAGGYELPVFRLDGDSIVAMTRQDWSPFAREMDTKKRVLIKLDSVPDEHRAVWEVEVLKLVPPTAFIFRSDLETWAQGLPSAGSSTRNDPDRDEDSDGDDLVAVNAEGEFVFAKPLGFRLTFMPAIPADCAELILESTAALMQRMKAKDRAERAPSVEAEKANNMPTDLRLADTFVRDAEPDRTVRKRSELRIDMLVQLLRDGGYDPQALEPPTNGRPRPAKQHVRGKVFVEGTWQAGWSESRFENAWQGVLQRAKCNASPRTAPS